MFLEGKATEEQKRERSRKFPEDIATEEQKKRKVTHVSGRQSDRGAKKEKGHACFREAKRQRGKKRERSRMFTEGKATEESIKRKVTTSQGNSKRSESNQGKGHACSGGFRKAVISGYLSAGFFRVYFF